MKKIVILLIASIVYFSCKSDNETLEGELYFKLVEFLPSKGLTVEQLNKISNEIDKNNGSNNAKDTILFKYLKKLKKQNVLGLPYINLKLNENTIIQIFLKNKEYNKLNLYTLDNLNKKGKKVIVKLNLREIDSSVYFANNIIDIKEIEGNSPWSK